MAITSDQIDKLEGELLEVALTKSIAYADKRVEYRPLDEMLRALNWAKGAGGGAGNAGSGRYKLATCASKGWRSPPCGGGTYKTSGDFYTLRPWSQAAR